MTALDGVLGHSPSLASKHAAAAQAATLPLSNSERKRQARARVEVERLRAARASAGEITAFRTEEQYWKDRTADPDWRNAFGREEDAVQWSGTVGVAQGQCLEEGAWLDRHGRSWRVQRCLLSGGRTAILFPDKPGLVFLPGHLKIPEQRDLISACLTETTGPASRTNLDTHYVPPVEGWWSAFVSAPERVIQPRTVKTSSDVVAPECPPTKRLQVDLPPMTAASFAADLQRGSMRKDDPAPGESVQPSQLRMLIRRLRWTILGLEYHWGTKSYKWDRPPMPMPALITSLTSCIISSIPWSAVFPSPSTPSALPSDDNRASMYTSWATSYRTEAGVVNLYQARDTLTAHVDQSEVDAVKPLVSISLGESAIFLLGTESRDEIPLPLLLQSGDVVVMSGPSRRVFHGVPRVVEGAMRADLLDGWEGAEEMVKFMRGTRINVNVRHVYEDS